jgi:hypothetical protein
VQLNLRPVTPNTLASTRVCSRHHTQTVDAFWKASSGDMSWHAGRDRAQRPRVVNDHWATSNSVARMWQVKVTGGRLHISACRLHVVLVGKGSTLAFVSARSWGCGFDSHQRHLHFHSLYSNPTWTSRGSISS